MSILVEYTHERCPYNIWETCAYELMANDNIVKCISGSKCKFEVIEKKDKE